jgi:hypothetical protein
MVQAGFRVGMDDGNVYAMRVLELHLCRGYLYHRRFARTYQDGREQLGKSALVLARVFLSASGSLLYAGGDFDFNWFLPQK